MSDFSTTLADRYRRGTTIAVVLITALWHVGNDATMLVMTWSQTRWPVVSAAMWFVYSTLAAQAAIELLRNGKVRRPWTLVAAAPVISAVVTVCVDGQVTAFANWGWGAVGWLGVMACWGRSLTPLFTVLVGNVVLSGLLLAVIGTPHRFNVAAFLVSAYGAIALQFGFTIGARMLRLAVGWAVEAATARGETEARRLVADRAHTARARRFELLQHTAADALRGLADGSSDPGDPAVRRRCAVEAARLRRLLLETDDVPDPLTHEVRACADIADRRGVPVDLRTAGPLPPVPVEIRRLLVDPLITVLSSARTHARITLSAAAGDISVSVVADAAVDPEPPPNGAIRVDLHREGESLWVQTSWRGPSPSQSSTITTWSSRASSPGLAATSSAG